MDSEQCVAFVRERRTDQRVGTGFLVEDRLLLTCAHVVNAALGRPADTRDAPPGGVRIHLEFPLLGSDGDSIVRPATVAYWRPAPASDFAAADVAVLHLDEDVRAQGGEPLTLVDSSPAAGSAVCMWGPGPGALGRHTVGRLRGTVGRNRLQIDELDRRVVPGFSGGPVWLEHTREVVGMLQAVPVDRTLPDVYLLAVPLLRDTLASVARAGLVHRAGLVEVDDHGEVHYDGSEFRLFQRRRLFNGDRIPHRSYDVTVSVVRFLNDQSSLNNKWHADHPLVADDGRDDPVSAVRLEGWYTLLVPGNGRGDHPELGRRTRMTVSPIPEKEHPARVEYTCDFPPRAPLTPGAEALIEYGYEVGDDKWGQWYQRQVKANTERMSVEAHLPRGLEPECWSTTRSPEDTNLRPLPDLKVRNDGDDVVYSWSGRADQDDLVGQRRIRLEWFFWDRIPRSSECEDTAAVLRQFGILQMRNPFRGAPLRNLPGTTRALSLEVPTERDLAERVLQHLRKVAGWVGKFHDFKPEVSRGIAAPQVRMAYKIAIVSLPEEGTDYDADGFPGGYLDLVNPRIVKQSAQAHTDYEGCLSFFDYRGPVTRPYAILVTADGWPEPREFTGSLARSIAHEIDHLNGKVYTDEARMPHGKKPIRVRQYQERRADGLITAEPPPRGPWLWREPDEE